MSVCENGKNSISSEISKSSIEVDLHIKERPFFAVRLSFSLFPKTIAAAAAVCQIQKKFLKILQYREPPALLPIYRGVQLDFTPEIELLYLLFNRYLSI